MELWELVRLVSDRYGKRLEQFKAAHPRAAELGELTAQQLQYLQAIRQNEASTISSLSAYFKVRSPTATVIVARLQEKGFVKKIPDREDKRSNRLALTPKALRLLSLQQTAFEALAGDIAAALSPEELEAYTRLTHKVCSEFEKFDHSVK